MAKLFLALDTPSLEDALRVTKELSEWLDGIKLGLEFFTAQGPPGVARLAGLDLPIFLDLKLHDIPNTVAGAIRQIAQMGVQLTTLHASGGIRMMQAAREAAGDTSLRLVAVTVLTSLDGGDWAQLGFAQAGSQVTDMAARLTDLAMAAALDGVVASAHEIASLRRMLGKNKVIVVPGIRLEGANPDDQKRIVTPEAAVAAGADILVVGRPILQAADRRSAVCTIRERMQSAFAAAQPAR